MGAVTPAPPESLPPIGRLAADEPFWRYGTGTAREGAAHLRVWLTAAPEPGYLAAVTKTASEAAITGSTGQIRAELASRYGPSVVLLEHRLAAETGEGIETLDLVQIAADGSPRWLRIWPSPADSPRHAPLERWMATYGYQIIGRPASRFGWPESEES
jgi:hypothetical protein